MLTNEDKRKIKGFKRWASRNDVVFSFLAPEIGSKEVTTIIRTLAAKGYKFEERGTPIVESEEGREEFISALREVVEDVIIEKATAGFKKIWQRLGLDDFVLSELAEAENEGQQAKEVNDA
jgi:hypothetical protein